MKLLRTFALQGERTLMISTEGVPHDEKRGPEQLCVSAIDAFFERHRKDANIMRGNGVVVRTAVVDKNGEDEISLAAMEHTRATGTRAIDPGQFLQPALAA